MAVIEFELAEDDYLRYQRHRWDTSASIQARLRFQRIFLSLFAAALVYMAADVAGPHGIVPLFVFVLGFLTFYFVMPSRARVGMDQQARALVRERSALTALGPQRLEFDEDGLRCIRPDIAMISGWHGVRGVEVDGNAAYVITDSPFALIVPRRAFADEDAFDAFVTEVRGRAEAARVQAADAPVDATA